ncbi:MAG: glycoside hydrolase family 25 protein [Actinomycetota bacterium]
MPVSEVPSTLTDRTDADPMTFPHRTFIRLVAVAALTFGASIPARAGDPLPPSADREGSLGASGEAAVASQGLSGPRWAGPTIPGIDISHWQGTIDWARVAGSGKAFVFMKATDDDNYVDPTFAANRAGARANGLLVGAYHFARPDPSTGDARREARFFVKVADPSPGSLLPVLDIETSQGLDQQGVTRWARTWVAEVRALTGVTPLVYTSPYGWQTRTGDTRLVARDGAPLWVAHWGVSSPTLPAADWDGHGWVVWQHTSDGHVAGIAGRVDLDKLVGTRLGRITIRRLTIEIDGSAGRVSSQPAGSGCAATCVRSMDPDATITLTAEPEDHAYFTGWTGACAGTDPSCTIQMRGNRSVGARFVTDIAAPIPGFASPSGFTDPVAVAFDERVRGVTSASIVLRRATGEREPTNQGCRDASGSSVRCDGTVVRVVRLTSHTPLVPGRDYVVVVNPARADPKVRDRVSNETPATSFAFEADRAVEQTQAPVVKRPAAAWTQVRTPDASGGSYAVSGRTGAAVRLGFDGTGIDWLTVTGPNRGRVQVSVDGELIRTWDLFAPVRTFGVVRTIGGLADRAHVLRIVVVGRHRPGSTGAMVAIDRFDITG